MAEKDLFKQERLNWLDDARAAVRKLLERQLVCTVEDVLAACPLPKYLHRNTIGRVFNTEDFIAVGWRKSRRRSMNGRQVRLWMLKEQFSRHVEENRRVDYDN